MRRSRSSSAASPSDQRAVLDASNAVVLEAERLGQRVLAVRR